MSIAAISAACLSEFRPKDAINGYCSPFSVEAGQVLEFFISSRVEYQIYICRLTDIAEGAARVAPEFELTNLPKSLPRFQRTSLRAWQDGCQWQSTDKFQVPTSYHSGLYAAECRGTDGSTWHVTFAVRPSAIANQEPILVLANSNTWNAYNDWGRVSRYTRDREISAVNFERPNPYASSNYEAASDAHLTRAELWLLRWLQSRSYQFDVCADSDFHSGTFDLNKYRAIILSTHPEYWTREMVARLRQYLSVGGNLLYLGGNGIFEAVTFSSRMQSLVFHDGDVGTNITREHYYFRNLDGQVCEREILGVAFLYDNYEQAPGPYRVLEPGHWLFNGTGCVANSLVGAGGYRGGACGREMDTSSGVPGQPGPTTPLVDAWSLHTDGSPGSDRGAAPRNLVVLAEGIKGTATSPHTGQMTYSETQSGGFVFAVGSYCFTGTLLSDAVLQKIVGNALARSLQ